jgi:hypothetical protein
MQPHLKGSAGGSVILAVVILNALVLRHGLVNRGQWYDALLITIPLLLAAFIAFGKKP